MNYPTLRNSDNASYDWNRNNSKWDYFGRFYGITHMICIHFSNNFFNCCLITHIILLQSFFQLINCYVPVQECASSKPINVKGQTDLVDK
jgi:hypothetical protein